MLKYNLSNLIPAVELADESPKTEMNASFSASRYPSY